MALSHEHSERHSRPTIATKSWPVPSLNPVYLSNHPMHQKKPEPPKIRFVGVSDSIFKVPETFFMQMPQHVRDVIQFTPGGGATPEKPIRLDRVSNHEFRRLLEAYTAYPYIDTKSLSLDHLLTIGSYACMYQIRILQQWFLPVFRNIVLTDDTPLNSAANDLYVRFLKIALSYGDTATILSITMRWTSKLHLGQLHPLTAIFFAELNCLTSLLSNAYYAYLMTVSQLIREGQNFGSNIAPTPNQRTHILAGYHSLRTYWRKLSENPPEFKPADSCKTHSRCVRGWETRWKLVAARPCPLPDVDVLGRSILVEKALVDDALLTGIISPACKTLALKAVAVKRSSIWKQLHHHFDL